VHAEAEDGAQTKGALRERGATQLKSGRITTLNDPGEPRHNSVSPTFPDETSKNTHSVVAGDYRYNQNVTEISSVPPSLARTPRPGITEQDLSRDVSRALRTLAKAVDQPLLLAYLSTPYDKLELLPIAANHRNKAAPIIALASFADANALASGDVLSLPSDQYLQWMEPRHFFGTDQAVLLGGETAVGRLLLLVLPIHADDKPSSQLISAIKAFFVDQLITYVDNALLAIDLDALTAEVGHLMGEPSVRSRLASMLWTKYLSDVM
jgi:hypothetical protein